MQRELETAREAARGAGELLMRHYGGEVKVAENSIDDPGAEADLASNEFLRSKIVAAFPDDGWLSEESSDSPERLDKKRVWIVDPLDGTNEFIAKVPEFCVCIALVEDGLPQIAVEYNPVTNELFHAIRGSGAFLNDAAIHVSDQAELRHARVLASRSEEERGEWDPYQPMMKVELTGSVAYKFARIAAGHADATFTLTPKNEWDVCAGTLLVTEAGGMVTEPGGRKIRFNNEATLIEDGLIASNGVLHRSILNTIKATRASME